MKAWADPGDNHLCGMLVVGRQFDGRMQTSIRRRNRRGLRLGVWYLGRCTSLQNQFSKLFTFAPREMENSRKRKEPGMVVHVWNPST